MYSGKMNSRITFFENVFGYSDYGENTVEKKELFSCWALKIDARIRELNADIGKVSEDTITFRIRERLTDKINEQMIIKHKNIDYEIVKIYPSERHNISTEIIVKKVT